MKLLIIALITFLAKIGFIEIPDLKWFSKTKDKDEKPKSK